MLNNTIRMAAEFEKASIELKIIGLPGEYLADGLMILWKRYLKKKVTFLQFSTVIRDCEYEEGRLDAEIIYSKLMEIADIEKKKK